MDQRLSPKQALLYRRVDEVLTYIWDPIGVRQVPQARDEYESYLPQVFKRVLEATGPEPIADYLMEIESERMGYSPTKATRQGALDVANLLLEHRDWINQSGAGE